MMVRVTIAQPSYTDGLEVFRIGMDHELSHRWCDSLEGPWTDWVPLEREGSPFAQAFRSKEKL